jgi:hypothetical protein
VSRAELLAGATEYLSDAVTGLVGAAKALDAAGVLAAAEQARSLHQGADALHLEVHLAASAAHRAERPEFYDESGTWVGRREEQD